MRTMRAHTRHRAPQVDSGELHLVHAHAAAVGRRSYMAMLYCNVLDVYCMKLGHPDPRTAARVTGIGPDQDVFPDASNFEAFLRPREEPFGRPTALRRGPTSISISGFQGFSLLSG